ncbi:MAG: VTT domain-containing protein [Alphaproteobacteria bacterium]|nr:VTT domain-containing protein [Alphaproteobacteria bacterium]
MTAAPPDDPAPAEAPQPPTTKRPLVLAIGVTAVFALVSVTAMVLPFDSGATLGRWLDLARHSPWAAPAAILGFAGLASIGAPQIVLIPALVAAFGPWAGFFYSWVGKLLHCSLGFAVGRRFGAAALARHAGPKLTATMTQLAKHGFAASAAIRMVPTVPSVVVNVAAGCTPIRFRDFIAGTALGSVPKMALIAFAGSAAIAGLNGAGLGAWLAVAAAVVAFFAVAVAGRAWMRALARK